MLQNISFSSFVFFLDLRKYFFPRSTPGAIYPKKLSEILALYCPGVLLFLLLLLSGQGPKQRGEGGGGRG